MPIKKRKPGRPKKVHPGGRPTKYKKEFNHQAFVACKTGGLDNLQLCELFAIKEKTLYNWFNDYPEFLQSIKDGKREYDNKNIVTALKHRALGYSHPEEKIFNNGGKPLIVPTTKHYPPETAAIQTWLYNRDPENWKNKKEVEHSGNIGIGKMTDEELKKEMLELESNQKTKGAQALITEGTDKA